MEIRVTSKGPDLRKLTAATIKNLRSANRAVGRDLARTGKAAITKGAPRMWGRKLSCKTKIDAWPDRVTVTFQASPAGGWAMQESGTRPHDIYPSRRDALHFDGLFAANVWHPGTTGSRAWTKALERLRAAVEPEVVDAYDSAMAA